MVNAYRLRDKDHTAHLDDIENELRKANSWLETGLIVFGFIAMFGAFLLAMWFLATQ